MKKSFLWVTDPWSTLDHSNDTSLRLIQEGVKLGLDQSWCDVKTIQMSEKGVSFEATPILEVQPSRNSTSVHWGKPRILSPSDFSAIHYRPDPPVDLAYLHPLQMLAIGINGKHPRQRSNAQKTHHGTEMINPLEVLFGGNEKMEAAFASDLLPPSFVSGQWQALEKFGKKYTRTVLKPLHLAQSQGIELLDWRTPDSTNHAREILSNATQQFQRPVLLQKYLEGISEGETRFWFLDGKLIAHARKQPVTGDFRVNMDRGSKLVSAPLSRREKSRIPKISNHLRQRKIRLAAIDLIEGYVTDFNFTSPGLIVQMENILSENLAKPIVKRLLKRG